MPDASYQDSILIEPTEKPFTFQGQDVTASRLVDVFTRTWELAAWRTQNVKRARDFRRNLLRVKLSQSWRDKFPDIASWAVTTMAERQTIEREQIARVNAVLSAYNREALDQKKLSDDEAGECERYMNEWRQQKLDQEEFGIKGVEDGEFGFVVLPAKDDMSGRPDFYDRISAEAYADLPSDEKKSYQQDATDRKGRYARVDDQGNKVPSATWNRDAKGRTADFAQQTGEAFSRDAAKSEEAHAAALDAYLLQHDASTTRLIPALDCVPIWGRGVGKGRFKLLALVERSLISIEEAVEADFGWKGFGNRAMIPRGFRENRTTGQHNDYYLYTLYTTSKDANGIEHPLIFYSLGGYATWTTTSGTRDGKDSVAMIDLYKTHGLTGMFWGYFGGMHTGDDDPYYRWQPWMFPFIETILSIEGTTTAIKSVIGTSAYPWWNYKPDAKLGELDDEAILETGPSGKTLRRPKIGKPGEVVTNAGDIVAQQPAQVSPDAWKMNQSEVIALQQNTSTTRPNDASGNALSISETLAQVNQAQVRGGSLEATVFAGECHLKILDAAHEKFGVDWPLNTTMPRAAGTATSAPRGSTKVARFDPAWLGDGAAKNYKLSATYPTEENLARVDLTRSLYKDRLASFADVQKDRGKEDSFEVRLEIAKDMLWEDPANQLLFSQRVAAITQNRQMQKILALKAQALVTGGGQSGLPDGIPKAILNRPGEQLQGGVGGGGGGASSVTAQRAGIQGGQVGTDTAVQQMTSNMGLPPGGAGAAA